ncbi:MAG: tail fiber domain-containing protein, partial [Thermoanaerobaculales bacterium]
ANTNGCLGCPTAGAVGYTAYSGAVGVLGNNVAGGIGVQGNSTAGGIGVQGNSTNQGGATGPGVMGVSPTSYGVEGLTSTSMGVYGQNQATSNDGCLGCPTDGVIGFTSNAAYHGVHGNNTGGAGAIGVYGTGDYGVFGSGGTDGVYGTGTANGVVGQSSAGHGVYGASSTGYGVYCAGDGTYTGSWTKSSDRRFKRDIVPLVDALAKVLQLRGVSFSWRGEEFPQKNFHAKTQIGFIAQEVETVYPELVSTDPEGYESLDYTELTPILVEAIKEQQATIEAQRAELDCVTERVARLEALLAEFAKRVPDPMPSR